MNLKRNRETSLSTLEKKTREPCFGIVSVTLEAEATARSHVAHISTRPLSWAGRALDDWRRGEETADFAWVAAGIFRTGISLFRIAVYRYVVFPYRYFPHVSFNKWLPVMPGILRDFRRNITHVDRFCAKYCKNPGCYRNLFAKFFFKLSSERCKSLPIL